VFNFKKEKHAASVLFVVFVLQLTIQILEKGRGIDGN
jgi:hypothetical protein